MRKLWTIAALATTVTSSPSLARDQSGYVGVEGGAMRVQSLDVGFSSEAIDIDDAFNIDLDTGFDADLIAGYDFGPIRVEGEIGYKRASIDELAVSSRIAPIASAVDGDGRASVLSGMVNLLLDLGADEGWAGYLGGGAGLARTKLSADVSGTGVLGGTGFDGSDRHLAWQAIAGFRVPVTEHIDLGAKYRYFRTKFAFQSSSEDLDGRFASHSVLASLIYNFSAPEPPPPSAPPPVAPPPPPPTQTCPDGSVVLASDTCPTPPLPPAPPPPEPERG